MLLKIVRTIESNLLNVLAASPANTIKSFCPIWDQDSSDIAD